MSRAELLQEQLRAEREGVAFVVVAGERLVVLGGERATIGRTDSNEIALPQDTEVSRLHAALERIAGEWTVVDDGLSRNGTFVNGHRIAGRTRLRDGDVIRVGRTALTFRRPGDETSDRTVVAADAPRVDVTPTQREVLVALVRPLRAGAAATPATNQAIADEVHLSVDAVKAHLRALFARFGLEDLPQNEKRARLAASALERGVVDRREL